MFRYALEKSSLQYLHCERFYKIYYFKKTAEVALAFANNKVALKKNILKNITLGKVLKETLKIH